ncbi:MAG: HD family phosphohydrolase [Bacteroidia bacterium]
MMNKIFDTIRNLHEQIFKTLLFLIALFLIVYWIPGERKFSFDYSKNKPWQHEELVAPFDFAIYKNENEINQEKELVINSSYYYFNKDIDLINKKISEFSTTFIIKWNDKYGVSNNNQKAILLKVGNELLNEIYTKGVISAPDEIMEDLKKGKSFYIIKNQIAELASINDVFTLKSAYLYCENKLKEIQGGEFLLSVINENIVANVWYNKEYTDEILKQKIENISLTKGLIQKGERIISKGEIVNDEKFEILESLKKEYIHQKQHRFSKWYIFLGQLILISLALASIYLFLYHFRKDIAADNKRIVFLLILMLLMHFLVYVSNNTNYISIYIIPFCILPIIIRTFYDTRLASFVHTICILTLGFSVSNSFEFIFLQIIAGTLTIFSIVNMNRRSQLFGTSLVIFVAYLLGYISFQLIYEGSITELKYSHIGYFAFNAMLTLFTYPLIYLFEKIFGFVSDVTLMELSDTNNPLLRELSNKAPGTFQHSLQVANLAESAIFEIGGNALLTRAGALYHDIGKMDNPLYFIENQTSGINPHNELDFEESAEIIISHVKKGVEKAKKHNLPDSVIDFIRTHHGDSVVQYFYRSYLKHFPDEIVDENKFRYPGPRPYSKETAVLMMADSVEAASRSLAKKDAESLENLVDSIIDYQIKEQQFVNADITFKDITRIKKIFKKKLQNIYHTRIEY